jgi:hypothetical protein
MINDVFRDQSVSNFLEFIQSDDLIRRIVTFGYDRVSLNDPLVFPNIARCLVYSQKMTAK